MPGSSWVTSVRRTAIIVVCLWALANVFLADSAASHANAVIRAARQQTGAGANGAPAEAPSLEETADLRKQIAAGTKEISASTWDRRVGLFQLLVILIGAISALALLAWQAGAAARLEHVDRSIRYGPTRVIAAWLVPGVNLVAPARSLSELFSRTDAGVGRRLWWGVVVALWWASCLAFAALALVLLAAPVSSSFDLSGPGRDRLLVGLGLVGVAIAILSVALVVWIDARLSNREIPEPEHPWVGWSPLRRG